MDKNLKADAPQSVDIESSLLGGLLIDADGFTKIGDLLHADDFYDPDRKSVV